MVRGMAAVACIALGACSGGQPRADAAVVEGADVSVAPGVDRPPRTEPWPVYYDAPPSNCSPAGGCDAGTCWQTFQGNFVCASFTPEPIGIYTSTCDAGAAVVFPGTECCISHTDCVRQPLGRCVGNEYMYCGGTPPPPGRHCRYDWCRDDNDCQSGTRCFPSGYSGDSAPRCIKASCRTAADCTAAPGGACAYYSVRSGCGGEYSVQAYCQYSNDPCRRDEDCATRPGGGACIPDEDGHGTHCGAPVTPPPPRP